MIKVVTIASLMLAATLTVVSVFADADAFGLTYEPARLLFSGGLGILAPRNRLQIHDHLGTLGSLLQLSKKVGTPCSRSPHTSLGSSLHSPS